MMNKPAAIYARVSSDRQKENHTIASQTAALIEYAQKNGYGVPPEWVFQDEGYSGAILVRPGLEALRDLAAEGQIAAVLVYSPDRLSRKYAYPVLLSEELSCCGVELIFLKAAAGATPEDQLLVQFQGMIAEYERAQIAERCRQGKEHMAHQGGVNVLSGAPFGYRYVKKSDTSAAFYEVMEAEAKVVRMVFEIYTQQGLSINAIARLLNERQVATRTGKGRWERSTVWGMLRNPAYRGTACYGKTEQRPRQRVTRPLRQRKAFPTGQDGTHRSNPRNPLRRSAPGSTGSPSGPPGRAPSVCPTAAASHSLLVCRRAVPLSACRSWCEATPGFRPEIPSHRLPTLRFLRSLRHPPRARPDWLAPVSIPLPAHRADRPDHTKRKTGTSAPAWPFGSASVSAKRVCLGVRLHSPVPSGLRYAPILP